MSHRHAAIPSVAARGATGADRAPLRPSEREGTRWMHAGEPILPRLELDATGAIVRIVCVSCDRWVHLDAKRLAWRHHRYRWTGARKPFAVATGDA